MSSRSRYSLGRGSFHVVHAQLSHSGDSDPPRFLQHEADSQSVSSLLILQVSIVFSVNLERFFKNSF